MKLKDEFVKLPKELVYDNYIRIVYNFKDYDKITRQEMLDDIIKEYNQENYLFFMCTEKELDFLEYSLNHKLTKKDLEKYEWEIDTLNDKCIFSKVTFEIFEQQIDNVKKALEYRKDHNKKSMEDVLIIMIAFVKVSGALITKALKSLIQSIADVDDKKFEMLLSNPMFNFYCEFSQTEIFDGEEVEEIIYRDYWEFKDELKELKKEYGMGGGKNVNFQDYFDIFYYGFPIRIPQVKKMYDEVSKIPLKKFFFKIIDEARVLHDTLGINVLIEDEKLREIIYDALYEIPCAAMNGFTPKEFEENISKADDIANRFVSVPQNNAHLCKSAADEYYKIYFGLLEYTNNKYKVNNNIKKIYKQEGINPEDLIPINDYLWDNKQILNEFIDDNIYNFNEQELEIVKGFNNAIKGMFTIVGFDREYTMVTNESGKVYMVKGIREDIDKIFTDTDLPKIILTTLLMFKNNIIYNGFFSEVPVSLGSNFDEMLLNELETAIKYYHL